MAKKKQAPPRGEGRIISLPEPAPTKTKSFLDSYTKWVYSATTLKASTFASIPIQLFRQTEIGRGSNKERIVEEVFDHPALTVLEFVNDFMTFEQLKEITSSYLDLAGEAPWVFIRDGQGNIKEIWPLRPDWIDIIPSSTQYISHYTFNPAGNTSRGIRINTDDLMFIKTFSPTNPYRGYSKVRAAAVPVDIDDFSDEFNRNLFFNRGIPDFLLTTDANMSEETTKRLTQEMYQNFGGRSNSRKLGVLNGGKWTVHQLGKDMQELDFLQSKEFLRDEILSAFHLSKSNLGISDDVNRSNAEAQNDRFLRDVIKPELALFVGFLNEFFLPNWNDPSLFFNFMDPVPEDREAKLDGIESGLKNSYLTINEARTEIGFPPVDGGDDIYLPMNLAPLGTSTQIEEEPVEDDPEEDTVEDDTEDNTEEDTEDDTEERGFFARLFNKKKPTNFVKITAKRRRGINKSLLGARIPTESPKVRKERVINEKIYTELRKVLAGLMQQKPHTETKLSSYTPEYKEMHWKELVTKLDLWEGKFIELLKPLIQEQLKEIIDKIEGHSNTLNKHITKLQASTFLFSVAKTSKQWKKVLTPMLFSVIKARGEQVQDDVRSDVTFDSESPEVKAFLRTNGTSFIKEVNDTTHAELIKTIGVGLREGEGVADLSKRVEGVFDILSKSRSTRIARTTMTGMANFGAEQGYEQSGVVEGKEWLSAMDERTRPSHVTADGQVQEVGESFHVGNSNLKYPGDPNGSVGEIVNCRCTVIPVLTSIRSIREAQEKEREAKKRVVVEEIYHDVTRRIVKTEIADLKVQKEKEKGKIKNIQTLKKEVKNNAIEEVANVIKEKTDIADKELKKKKLVDSIYSDVSEKMINENIDKLKSKKSKEEESIKNIQDLKNEIREEAIKEIGETLEVEKKKAASELKNSKAEDSAIAKGALDNLTKAAKQKGKEVDDAEEKAKIAKESILEAESKAKKGGAKIVKEAKETAVKEAKKEKSKILDELKILRTRLKGFIRGKQS